LGKKPGKKKFSVGLFFLGKSDLGNSKIEWAERSSKRPKKKKQKEKKKR